MMRPRSARSVFTLLLAVAAGTAQAQQIYRWTDEKGALHITDTPPPPSAKNVKKEGGSASGSASAPAAAPGQQSFELTQAIRDFPVVLYTSPVCKEPCALARAALNKRGVPFKEVQLLEGEGTAELRKLSGSNEVPTLLVGRSVQKGFAQEAYDALLDAARYPRAGVLPARAQAAPPTPEGYVPPPADTEPVKAEPVKPEEPPKLGPYSPGAPRQQRTPAQ